MSKIAFGLRHTSFFYLLTLRKLAVKNSIDNLFECVQYKKVSIFEGDLDTYIIFKHHFDYLLTFIFS